MTGLQPVSSSMNRHQLAQFDQLAKDGHGWVLARPDGTKAHCGGPEVCRICQLEHLAYSASEKVVVFEGFNIKAGDKLLLIGPPWMQEHHVDGLRERLKRDFPEVDITIMAGFTGVQVHRQEPSV